MSERKAKFRVGQVVRVLGGKVLRSYVPDYFRISGVNASGKEWIYRVSDHDYRGPWLGEKNLRPLTKRERGGK